MYSALSDLKMKRGMALHTVQAMFKKANTVVAQALNHVKTVSSTAKKSVEKLKAQMKEKKKAAKPNLVLFSCRKSRFLFVVLSPTLQLGLKALPLKISSLHIERTTCELKSQPAPETREEWSFRRKQQYWGSGFPSQSPFYGASNKRVARYFLFARLSEGHSRPLRDLFGWCASGASRAEILNSGATVAEVMKWGSLLALRIDLADEKCVFF